jgi:hypothetical protein
LRRQSAATCAVRRVAVVTASTFGNTVTVRADAAKDCPPMKIVPPS